MKLIKQSFEILNQKDFTIKGIKQFIERCARVSYKSEDKITDTSYEKFVNTLETNDHSRPLEFGTVHIKMPYTEFERFKSLCDKLNIWNAIWIKYNISKSNVYITTNYRYYKDLCLAIDLDRGYVIPYLEDFSLQRYFTIEDNELFPKRYTVHMILSRAIMDEFRTHVGLSHLAESTRYCVSGDTLLKCKNPHNHYTIKELWEDRQSKNRLSQVLIEVLNIDTGILEYSKIKNVFNNGTQKVYKVTTELGYSLKCTSDHQIYTPNDWKSLSELKIGDKIYVNGAESPVYQNNLMTVCSSCHQQIHNQSLTSLYGDKIIAITEIGEAEVFDLEIETYHNYVANGIIVHNCNYSKNKFSNSITAIIPNYIHLNYDSIDLSKCSIGNNEYFQDTPFYDSNDIVTRQFLESMQEIEYYYFALLKEGCKPQEARDILPLNVKSELVSCGFKDAWENFFYRRCDSTAHPMAKEIANQIKSSIY
jgi:thymidylate synthase ThyX